jgi:hypothetical protein
MARAKERVNRWIVNQRGWSTPRQILAIESDDWGMVRMASTGAYKRLKAKGYPVDQCPYNRFDRLESVGDLSALCETLRGFEDIHGRHAKITMNMIMANPDFEAIERSAFTEYAVQPFEETLRVYGEQAAIDVYRQGADEALFRPQLHGREHTAWARWLAELRANTPAFCDAFTEGMYAVHPGGRTSGHRDCLDALGYAPSQPEFHDLAASVDEAQAMFEAFWEKPSRSFIAPCYTWHPALEPAMAKAGIRYLQGTRVQRVPNDEPHGPIRRRRHYTGQRNAHGQRYIVRNVDLEPSTFPGSESACLDEAMEAVAAAFSTRVPAVVSSHRVNFMGSLDADNRARGLRVLSRFLESVQARWPRVEFMSTDELGELMDA